LPVQCQHISFATLRDHGNQCFHIGSGRGCREFAVPQRHVEGRMLAAHEVCDIPAVPAPEREQQQRPALGVGGDHDEGAKAVAIADLALPGREEVKPLIGSVGLLLLFEFAPDRLGLAENGKNIDGGDAAGLRPHRCLRRSAFDGGSHGHRNTWSENLCNFRLWPAFAGKCQQRVVTMPPPRGMFEGRGLGVG
jgi:hypothetical protein